jgi:NAD(P)-dependent dehydrogenase (short-subunit alcohol dehydrogenase family)
MAQDQALGLEVELDAFDPPAGGGAAWEQRVWQAVFRRLRHLRLGEAGFGGEECGDLFVFLASDQARYITGQSVAIDGGVTL